MYQIPLDNINFRPLDIWGLGDSITDFLYYDPEFVNNASITNRGTSGTNATGYSGKSYDFDGVSDFVTLSVSATLTYIELWVRPDTTTMAICDFGAGKEIALTTGTVGTTGLGTVSVTVDGVSSTTMVALKWQLLRVTLDSPTAITTLRLGRNDTTYGSGQISDVQINDSTSYLETNQASATGIFDSVQGVLATNSGCALIEGLSGLENGETHNGIPQSFSKNWNRYDYFNNNAYVVCDTSDFDTQADGQVVELDFIAGNVGAPGYIVFSVRDNVANPLEYILVASQSNAVYLYVLKGSLKFDSVAVSVGQRVVATLTFNGSSLTSSLIGTIDGVPFSLSANAFGAFSPISKMTLGATFVSSYSQLFQGLFIGATINSTAYNVFNNYNSIGLSGTTPVKNLAPENPSSLGNDIFANAIVDPQPKFKLDGASYGDTGQTVAIDYNTPFTITANGVYIYDSTSNNAIFSNRDNTANQRGVLAYLDTSNRPVLLMQLNTTTRVQVQSNVAISNDDNVQWISDGTGDASGVTIKINAAAVATTTLQDQDISAGITSAANAYFGIDLDGTANELKGSTSIITLDL